MDERRERRRRRDDDTCYGILVSTWNSGLVTFTLFKTNGIVNIMVMVKTLVPYTIIFLYFKVSRVHSLNPII